MSSKLSPAGPGFAEFVVLMAFIISLVALSIDAMLPALPEIAAELASLINSQMVMRFGMRCLSQTAMISIAVLSSAFILIVLYYQGHPPLPMLMAYLLGVFFFMGILFGNLNALAMEPLGHIAGLGAAVGAAVVGSVSTLIAVGFGVLVAAAYDGTILPLVIGFAGLSIACLITIYWTERISNLRSA